eukprot:537911-Pyramimonas_sp.AAC.1
MDRPTPLLEVILLRLLLPLDSTPHCATHEKAEKTRTEALHSPGPATIIHQGESVKIELPADPGQEQEEGSN